jgi:hypothetical protein
VANAGDYASFYVDFTSIQTITGTKTFNSLRVPQEGTALSTRFQNTSGTSVIIQGANRIGFNNSNNLYISGSQKGSSVFVVNNSATRNYTFQDNNGTLAFTSDLNAYLPLTGGTVASSGSTNTLNINHTSGSGIALDITKAGNGEGIRVNKTSGSGNAATIIGTLEATTLVKTGGTASQFLMADGSVSTLTNPITGTGAAGRVSFWTGANTQGSDSGLVWDNVNNRLVIRRDGSLSTILELRSVIDTTNTNGGAITFQNLFSTDTDGNGIVKIFCGTGTGVDRGFLGFATSNGNNSPTLKWSILQTGILQSNGAQTIQTSTGNLTLATAGGDGNILLSPNGTGKVGIGTTSPDFSLDVNGNIGVTQFSQVFAKRATNLGTNPTLTLTLKSTTDVVGAIYCLDLIVSFGTTAGGNPSSAKIVYMFTTSRTSGVTTISNITNMDTITAGSITSISTNTSGNTISFVFNGADGGRVSAQGRIVTGNARVFVGFLSADWA